MVSTANLLHLYNKEEEDPRLGSSACYGFIYPNMMVNRYGPWLDTNWVVPLGPQRCKVVFDWYVQEELADDAAFIAESIEASEQVQMEDMGLCRGVQRGVASPGYGVGRYAPSVEGAMYHFHEALYDDLCTPRPAPPPSSADEQQQP